MLGMNLKELIGFAYDVESYRVSAQGSSVSKPFDVIAKIPDDVAKLPNTERWQRIHVLTQSLLSSRFHLTLRRESKEMPVYTLALDPAGCKLPQKGLDPGDEVVFVDRRPGHLSAQDMPMSELLGILTRELGHPVLDRTGIKRVFDITLDWAPEAPGTQGASGAGENSADAPDNRPTLFTAVKDQLGLRLQAGKSPIEVIEVDHAEEPSEN